MTYEVKVESITVEGGEDLQIRSLLDREQYADTDAAASDLGISSASWPLFGQLWPSARVLADRMQSQDLRGMRILEIGCGLALPSLVAHRRHADVTASDHHPLTESFLLENLKLNALPPLPYLVGNWATLNPALGRFDLIVGSDILYERDQPDQLRAFIERHTHDKAQIMIVDPNRGQRAAFSRAMTSSGFDHAAARVEHLEVGPRHYRGQVLSYWRGTSVVLRN